MYIFHWCYYKFLNHFDFSTPKRKEQYSQFMIGFIDADPLKILKRSAVRHIIIINLDHCNAFSSENIFHYVKSGFQLKKIVFRTLHHWEALSSYFNIHHQLKNYGKVYRSAYPFKILSWKCISTTLNLA